MKLSIVMPVYNEEATLREIVARVLATSHEKELLLVDDCSQDSSPEIIAELAAEHPEVRSFRHETNQGKGAALRTGFQNVEGDAVVIQDADLEYDPRDYNKLLEPILDGRADVVYGSRFLGGPHPVLNFHHYLANRFLTFLSNVLTNLNLTDMETCYKVFRREVIEEVGPLLRESRFGIEPEITARIAKRKFRVFVLSISYSGRTYEQCKKIGWRDGVAAIWCIVRYGLTG